MRKTETNSIPANPAAPQYLLLVRLLLALIALVLVFLVILEVGRYWVTYNAVQAALRDALAYGAAPGLAQNGVPLYQDCDGIKNSALRTALIGGFKATDIEITYAISDEINGQADEFTHCPDYRAGQNWITIQINTRFKPIPLVSFAGIPLKRMNRRMIGGTEADESAPPTPQITLTSSQTPTQTLIPPRPIFPRRASLTPSLAASATATFRAVVPIPKNTQTSAPSVQKTSTAVRTVTPSSTPTSTNNFSPTPSRTPTRTAVNTATKTHTVEPSPTRAACQIPAEAGGCQ